MDEYKIIQDKFNNTIFKIEFPNYSKPILKSIQNQLIGSTISNNYQSITFNALNVKTLNEYKNKNNISYDIILKMIFSLSKQLDYLINNESKIFLIYNSKNIIVIDDKFIYLSNNYLINLNIENKTIQITSPFCKEEEFISPELLKIKRIPSIINYKIIYYSLGCLAIHTLTNININNIKKEKEEEEKEDLILTSIKNTKLFYLLKRCVHKNFKKRTILYF